MSDEVILQQLKVIGYNVNKIQKGAQVVYRLADDNLLRSLPLEEKKRLTEEISKLHNMELARISMQQQWMMQNSRHMNSISTANFATFPNAGLHQSAPNDPAILNGVVGVGNTEEIRQNISVALLRDHERITKPDLSRFQSFKDAVERLLPYHVYQYRTRDTLCDIEKFNRDAERNAIYLAKKADLVLDRANRLLETNRVSPDCKTPELTLLCEKILMEDDLMKFRFQYREFVTIAQIKNSGVIPGNALLVQQPTIQSREKIPQNPLEVQKESSQASFVSNDVMINNEYHLEEDNSSELSDTFDDDQDPAKDISDFEEFLQL